MLNPHTDPYDVYVFQAEGAKIWHTCTPSGSGSDADRCLRQEQENDSMDGCTQYTELSAENSLNCKSYVMQPGGVLFMPKGTVHWARTLDHPSLHITFGLHQTNMEWLDAFQFVMDSNLCFEDTDVGAELLFHYAGTATGSRLHKKVPAWAIRVASVDEFTHAFEREKIVFKTWLEHYNDHTIEWLF